MVADQRLACPLVDALTVRLQAAAIDAVTPEAKRAYAGLMALDLPGEGGVTTTVTLSATRAAQTLAQAFQTGRSADLVLPQPPSAIELAGLDALAR